MSFVGMPKGTVGELLLYMADYENFDHTCKELNGEMTPVQIKAVLRDVGGMLVRESRSEEKKFNLSGNRSLNHQTKEMISCLSPNEERKILATFGLLDVD